MKISRKSPNSAGDRFIPNRKKLNVDISNYHLKSNRIRNDRYSCAMLEAIQEFNQKKHYRDLLWSTMFPTCNDKKVLHFSSVEDVRSKEVATIKEYMWPVKPRKKPLIKSPSSILDMPNIDTQFGYFADHHMIDWSSTGYLATIYDDEIILCHPERPYMTLVRNAEIRHCIKWNREGNLLAIALEECKIVVWGVKEEKTLYHNKCSCLFCIVKAMEWSKDGLLLTGCSEGRLCVWTHDLKCVKIFCNAHFLGMWDIKLSCNEKYLATNGRYGTIRIWKWPTLEPHFEINHSYNVKSLDWHPWKESLLALAVVDTFSVWNVAMRKQVVYERLPQNFHIDSISFNPASAELVMSYRHYTKTSGADCKILILSDLNTVEDVIDHHVGRVVYLMWSSDGYQLATAGEDENLCLWDFFGPSIHKDKKPKRSKSKTSSSNSVRLFECIR